MGTTQIINGLGNEELLKWKVELKSILDGSRWKLIKTERALHLFHSALQECTEKLESERKRVEETKMAMQFLSPTHPLRHKCEDDLYKTEIRIFRLQNKLNSFSSLKLIQLEIKKAIVSAEINYYEGLLKSISNSINPPVVLRRILNTPDGETRKNLFPSENNLFPLVLIENEADEFIRKQSFGNQILSSLYSR